jgi:hypothetical protein
LGHLQNRIGEHRKEVEEFNQKMETLEGHLEEERAHVVELKRVRQAESAGFELMQASLKVCLCNISTFPFRQYQLVCAMALLFFRRLN